MNKFFPSDVTHGLLSILIVSLIPSDVRGSPWVVHETLGGLEIFSEFQISVRNVHEQLSSVATELDSLLSISGNGGSVQVIVFSSRQNYWNYLSTRIPEARNRRAIFYRNGDLFQIYTFRHNELLTDLRHEYTHALLHQSLPYIPLWIDEGLAEFMEEQPEQRARSSRLASMRWKCRTGWHPNLDSLERIPSASAMSSQNYRDSWAWIHFLLMDSESSRSLLKLYLQAVSAGEAPGAFSEWTAARESKVVNRIGSYFRRFRFSLR